MKHYETVPQVKTKHCLAKSNTMETVPQIQTSDYPVTAIKNYIFFSISNLTLYSPLTENWNKHNLYVTATVKNPTMQDIKILNTHYKKSNGLLAWFHEELTVSSI